MMNVEDLLKQLTLIPKTATVYISSDHGQCPEPAGQVYLTEQTGVLPYDGEELEWRSMPLDPKELLGRKITGVLIV